jgi:hypothetical protein
MHVLSPAKYLVDLIYRQKVSKFTYFHLSEMPASHRWQRSSGGLDVHTFTCKCLPAIDRVHLPADSLNLHVTWPARDCRQPTDGIDHKGSRHVHTFNYNLFSASGKLNWLYMALTYANFATDCRNLTFDTDYQAASTFPYFRLSEIFIFWQVT